VSIGEHFSTREGRTAVMKTKK